MSQILYRELPNGTPKIGNESIKQSLCQWNPRIAIMAEAGANQEIVHVAEGIKNTWLLRETRTIITGGGSYPQVTETILFSDTTN